MRSVVALVVLLAGSLLYGEQHRDAITLDVVLDEAGQRGPLTAPDFTVSEGGQPLAIESVRLVQPSAGTAPLPQIATDGDEESVAAQGGRLVGIYIDEYHLSDDEGFVAARVAVAAFLRGLGPRDLVVVLKPLDSLVSIRMTSDREKSATIVDESVPRQGDYTPRSTFEQNFIAGAPARIEAARNQIALSSISALAAHLGGLQSGRKTLIVVSNGLTGQVTSPRGDQPLPGLESIARTANRSNVAIYAIHPSPGIAGPAPREVSQRPAAASPDLLDALAQRTTGFAVSGGGAAAAGLERVLSDASRYYLLTLTPRDGPVDGRFREVSVSVRRPGVTFRARAGYGASPADLAASAPRVTSLPPGLKIPRRSTTLIRTWFGRSAGEDGRTRIAFVWEPAPSASVGRTASPAPARVTFAVTTMDGTTVFSGTSGPSGRDAFLVPGARPELSFESKPGPLLLQMEILDAAGRVLDHDVRDLAVTGFTAPLSLGSAAVYRARTARDLRAMLADDSDIAPVASRQFSRTEHLVVRFPVVARDDNAATVTVRLLNGFGSTMRELPVTQVGTATDVMQVDLPLASFASGRYALEFNARTSSGSAVDRLEFAVTP